MNDTTKPSEYLGYWGEKYKNDLLTDILPFWLKYGIDHENGGYFTCLDRDGSLLDTNKSVWFQGVEFTLSDLESAYNAAAAGETVELPNATVETPDVTAEQLQKVLFRDVLST